MLIAVKMVPNNETTAVVWAMAPSFAYGAGFIGENQEVNENLK